MQHEMLTILAFQRIDDLLVLAGAQRIDHKRLGLAAGKQRRSVSAFQNTDLGHDLAHCLGVPTVDANPGFQDVAAHDFLFKLLEKTRRHCNVELFFLHLLERAILGRGHGLDALLLDGLGIGVAQWLLGDLPQTGFDRLDTLLGRRQRPGLLGAVVGEIHDEFDDFADRLMGKANTAQRHVLVEFLDLGLDHQHAFHGACDEQVHVGGRQFIHLRVQDVFAIDIADTRAADRSQERNARNCQRGRRADQADNIRVVLQIMRQYGADDLGLVAEFLVEQRPDRPIDQA